ncbi:LytTR family DNA-binding domain-containing protein [Cellulosilyticum sp. ST5]|uniref:Response regulator receiver protein n=1 Tax=Cellulosilyticum lentocellum (strain ATCC 49066 / DSM 5427 / NCIMB 11756 / RHM5) TaxID=642492 RepID=F2JIU8_CELLD|nr:LytTR family DNA-binding domain-containing protein [Cellulosilyticum lentocellum]ADZ82020.1 response regulator receiver protein [Cellulosilyticum lentocellum DSM 5427]
MKFILEQSDEWSDVEIRVRCGQIDKSLEKLIEQIRLYGFSITGEKDGETFTINLEQIFYFETVDNRTYAYCEDSVYECKQKLYELEERLGTMNFQRISRSCILNIYKLLSIRTLLNGRVEAKLENGEKLIVNRHYAESLRQKIEEQGV